MASSEGPIHILFVGNPGTGKSTMLNGLMAEARFKSGVNFGKGLTYEFQKEVSTNGDFVFMDTPGLADADLRKQAAAAIDTALRQNGTYKVFFTATIEEGRVRPDDVTTIKLVLEAAQTLTAFGVIVNKVAPKLYNRLVSKEPEKDKNGLTPDDNVKLCLQKGLTEAQKRGFHLFYNARDDDLESVDDAVMEMSQELQTFIQSTPSVQIRKEDVKDVNAESFDELKDKYERELTELRQSAENMKAELEANAEHMKRMKADNEQREKEVAELKNRMEEDRLKHEKTMREQAKKHDKEMEGQRTEMGKLEAKVKAAGKALEDAAKERKKEIDALRTQQQNQLNEMKANFNRTQLKQILDSLSDNVKMGEYEAFTKGTLSRFEDAQGNVMVCHNEKAQLLHGDPFRRDVEIKANIFGGTKGFMVYVAPYGEKFAVRNNGDGGYVNWAFSGHFKRDGNTVEFH